MKEETDPKGLCGTQPVQSAVNHARFLLSPLKADLYTAGTATDQREDSRVNNVILELLI